MKNTFSTVTHLAGRGALVLFASGLIFGGYVFLSSLPDLKRYIRISTM